MQREGSPNPLLTDDAGRAAAIDELHWHRDAGRIDDDTLAIRIERAERARTKADLAILFADLPRQQTMPVGAAYTDRIERARSRRRSAQKVVAIAAAIALGLFLLMGLAFDGWFWCWIFVVIPIAAVIAEWRNLTAKPAQPRLAG